MKESGKDSSLKLKKNISELSFNILENDDNKSELGFLKA